MELSLHHIITDKHWEDLVLSPGTIREILELKEWISNQRTTIVASAEKNQGGNHVVFYGPAGSGKRLTASLLARESGKALYRIDLSDAASKYIGETEKNLDAFFHRLRTRDGSCFLMRRMHYLERKQKHRNPVQAMLILKAAIFSAAFATMRG